MTQEAIILRLLACAALMGAVLGLYSAYFNEEAWKDMLKHVAISAWKGVLYCVVAILWVIIICRLIFG